MIIFWEPLFEATMALKYVRHMVMSYAPNKTTNLRLGGCTPVGVRGRAACAAWHFGGFHKWGGYP